MYYFLNSPSSPSPVPMMPPPHILFDKKKGGSPDISGEGEGVGGGVLCIKGEEGGRGDCFCLGLQISGIFYVAPSV